MGIKRYGLDEAEINSLREIGLSDDEINAANEKRIKAQMDGGYDDCVDGTDIPLDSIGAALGIGQDDDEDTPILTNNEYYTEEAKILKANGLSEPEIPSDDASKEALDEWAEKMKAFVAKKQSLCADIRRRRQLGAYEVSNGKADGDVQLPSEWTMESMYS